MTDMFDNPILCRKCKKEMKKIVLNRNGFNLRALHCDKCNETILHPVDEQEYKNFIELKRKEFNVKMRMVGNSYAVSIPREIVDFMREQERIMSNMVRLGFEDARKLSLKFGKPQTESRVVRAKEVRIVRNNKPIYHEKEFYDSEHPEKSKKIIKRAKEEKDENLEKLKEEDR